MAHVAEECGEFVAAFGKSCRWGWDSVNPELPKSKQETNLKWMRREMRDLKKAIYAAEEFLVIADHERIFGNES